MNSQPAQPRQITEDDVRRYSAAEIEMRARHEAEARRAMLEHRNALLELGEKQRAELAALRASEKGEKS